MSSTPSLEQLATDVKEHDLLIESVARSLSEYMEEQQQSLVDLTGHLIESLRPKLIEIIKEEMKNHAVS